MAEIIKEKSDRPAHERLFKNELCFHLFILSQNRQVMLDM